MNPIDRYAKNFARVVYHGTVDDLDAKDIKHIHRLFDYFKTEYHDQVAEYPLWIQDAAHVTPRDRRRVEQCFRNGDWPIFLFSLARVEAYLDHLEQAQNS